MQQPRLYIYTVCVSFILINPPGSRYNWHGRNQWHQRHKIHMHTDKWLAQSQHSTSRLWMLICLSLQDAAGAPMAPLQGPCPLESPADRVGISPEQGGRSQLSHRSWGPWSDTQSGRTPRCSWGRWVSTRRWRCRWGRERRGRCSPWSSPWPQAQSRELLADAHWQHEPRRPVVLGSATETGTRFPWHACVEAPESRMNLVQKTGWSSVVAWVLAPSASPIAKTSSSLTRYSSLLPSSSSVIKSFPLHKVINTQQVNYIIIYEEAPEHFMITIKPARKCLYLWLLAMFFFFSEHQSNVLNKTDLA